MSDLPTPTAIGELLRRTRELSIPRLSQAAVAHQAGVDTGTLGNIERGYRNLGNGEVRPVAGEADVIAKVALALRISAERLAGEGRRPDAAEALREMSGAEASPRPELVPPPVPSLSPGDDVDQKFRAAARAIVGQENKPDATVLRELAALMSAWPGSGGAPRRTGYA